MEYVCTSFTTNHLSYIILMTFNYIKVVNIEIILVGRMTTQNTFNFSFQDSSVFVACL